MPRVNGVTCVAHPQRLDLHGHSFGVPGNAGNSSKEAVETAGTKEGNVEYRTQRIPAQNRADAHHQVRFCPNRHRNLWP